MSLPKPGNPISLSIAPATRVIGRHYHDLPATLDLMRRLWQESVVDGFEFQNLAEWDATGPPRDEGPRRREAWQDSERYTTAELTGHLQAAGLPILSVHANRDVGVCLCSGDRPDVARGTHLIRESLSLVAAIGAPVCVFHLWDTWKEKFDLAVLHRALARAAAAFPAVKASVENVPTHLSGFTPYDLVSRFQWITLDLGWAAIFDELGRFEAVIDRVANVHLRGRLQDGRWVLDGAPFGFYEALNLIRGEWGYGGPLTMEPAGLQDGDLEALCAAMVSLRPDP